MDLCKKFFPWFPLWKRCVGTYPQNIPQYVQAVKSCQYVNPEVSCAVTGRLLNCEVMALLELWQEGGVPVLFRGMDPVSWIVGGGRSYRFSSWKSLRMVSKILLADIVWSSLRCLLTAVH